MAAASLSFSTLLDPIRRNVTKLHYLLCNCYCYTVVVVVVPPVTIEGGSHNQQTCALLPSLSLLAMEQ